MTASFLVPKIRLDRTLQLDRQRLALAVKRLAGSHPDPAFADAVFLDIGLLCTGEANADAAFQQGGVIIRAIWIAGEAVGRFVRHRTLKIAQDTTVRDRCGTSH